MSAPWTASSGRFGRAMVPTLQEPTGQDGSRNLEPITFTVDVAEDLAGKFVPTFVKPEHGQPERGSFFITEGRLFPAGTIQGDGSTFHPAQSGHIGIWICRGTHLVAANQIPAASLRLGTSLFDETYSFSVSTTTSKAALA